MTPTLDFLNASDKRIRVLLQELRPALLKAQGAIEHRLKDDKSVVTEMDVMVEKRLRDALAEVDSSIGFGGEETGVDFGQKTFWLVDPIDGTEAFVRGLPFWTSMITLIDDGAPVMSVIYNFTLDEYYLAIKGHGATRNGHPIQVSSRPMKRSFIVSGSGFGRAGLIGTNDRLRDKVAGLAQANASGFELSGVAAGAYEGRIMWNTSGKEWDFTPGCFLIQEAGGRVENIDTPGEWNYRNLKTLAASPVVFDELMEFVIHATTDKTA
jgi:myo-inositol-1(or 4)-monophosphatase